MRKKLKKLQIRKQQNKKLSLMIKVEEKAKAEAEKAEAKAAAEAEKAAAEKAEPKAEKAEDSKE